MNEIKFKYGTTAKENTSITPTDIVMVNDAMLSESTAENYDTNKKFGSVYRGDKIVGTTKAEELCLTEDLTVEGVTVGGVSTGVEFKAGDSLDLILRKILQKEIDATFTAPNVKLFKECADTVEVGKSVDLGLSYSFTDGKYTAPNGNVVDAECGEQTSTYYHNNTEQQTKPTTVPTDSEGSQSYKVNVPYSEGKTAAVLDILTNLKNPSKKTAPAGTATSNTVTITVAKKWYIEYGGATTEKWTTNMTNADLDGANTEAVFYIPNGYVLAQAKQFGTNVVDKMEQESLGTYNGSTYSYTKYTFQNPNSDSLQLTDIKISK